MEKERAFAAIDDEWKHSYQIIKEKHDEAYFAVDAAIKLEEGEKPEQALAEYKLGIAMIDEALSTPVALPEDDNTLDESWTNALKMIQKMKRTRTEIQLRIGTIIKKLYPMDEAEASDNGNGSSGAAVTEGAPKTFRELGDALQNLQYDVDHIPNSLDLLFLCDGVKLYHISATGEVTTTDESCTLRIVRLDKQVADNLQTSFFMQIIHSADATEIIEISDDENEASGGVREHKETTAVLLPHVVPGTSVSDANSLIYPLVAGASPCFLTEYGAFIFPDLESPNSRAAIGLVIPDESAELALEILEATLHGVVKQGQQQPASLSEWEDIPEDQERQRRALSEQISNGIIRGAGHLSYGLVRGSEKVGEFMSYSTPYIMAKLNKAPENAPPVSNKVVGGVEMAKSATNVAVNVTGYIAGKVGSATMALGRFLAPHVQCQGSKLLSKTTGMTADKAAETVSLLICN